MRHLLYLLLLSLIVAVGVRCKRDTTADRPFPSHPTQAGDRPAGKTASQPQAAPADNSRCHVCHINYEDEQLAVAHALAGIGCESCHGPSDDHCGDEGNVTPPDTMIPKDTINPFCIKCHPTLPNDGDHEPFVAGTAENETCTDCHGKHRLAHRTIRWDRKTRKLLDTE